MTTSSDHPDRDALLMLLERHGWTRGEVFRDAERWRTPTEAEPATVLVPRDEDVPDYLDVVSLVIERVARAAGTDRATIENELTAPRSDILRLALETDEASIPLRESSSAYRAVRDLITAALRSAEAPRRRYGGRLSSAVALALDDLEVTAPQVGSFSITVESPLTGTEAGLPPLARQAFIRLATVTTDVVRRGVELTSPRLIERGASANLYRAIAELIKVGRGTHDLRLEFVWAPALRPPIETPHIVSVPAQQRPRLLEAAASLGAAEPAIQSTEPRLPASTRQLRFVITRGPRGQYAWQLKDPSGVALATSSEEYATRQAAREAVDSIRRSVGSSRVEYES